MKKCIVFLSLIFLSCSPAIVTNDSPNDCDSIYLKLLDRLEKTSEVLNKEKYRSQIEKAYRLCKEGKNEEASKILEHLKADVRLEKVFESPSAN